MLGASTTVSPADRAEHIDPQAEAAANIDPVGFETDQPAVAKHLERSGNSERFDSQMLGDLPSRGARKPADRPPATASKATSSRVTQSSGRKERRRERQSGDNRMPDCSARGVHSAARDGSRLMPAKSRYSR